MSFFRRITVSLVFIILAATGAAGCAQQAGTPAASSRENHGIQPLTGFGIMPLKIYEKGLGVYGSGRVEAGKDTVQVEIDSANLDKVKVGYAVSLMNIANQVALSGKVASLPDASAVAGDTCKLVVALNIDDEAYPGATASAAVQASATPAVTAGENGQYSSYSESSSIFSGGKPTVDSDVEATIYLPAQPGVYCIDNKSICKGDDGKNYIWVSTKTREETKADDWKLREVRTGKTDGKRTEILDGLKDVRCIAAQ